MLGRSESTRLSICLKILSCSANILDCVCPWLLVTRLHTWANEPRLRFGSHVGEHLDALGKALGTENHGAATTDLVAGNDHHVA